MNSEEIAEVITRAPGANLPHRHMPASAGEAARQLLAYHPRSGEATADDIREIVRLLGEPDNGVHTPYTIGDMPAGMMGHPGTWISTGPAGCPQLQLSATIPLLYPQDAPAPDTTLLDRLAVELKPLVEALGGDPEAIRLLDRTRGEFSGDDIVAFATDATESGRDTFSGFFSHNRPPYFPGVQRSLDHAASTIVLHQKHGAEIRARITALHAKAVARFEPLGSTVGDATLIGVMPAIRGVDSVEVAIDITILGDTLKPVPVLLRMSDAAQVSKGEFDGYRIHARDLRRRLKLLAGRDPLDVYEVCPVAARSYEGLSGDGAEDKARQIRGVLKGSGGGDGNGADMTEGRLLDTVMITDRATFRNRTLMVKGVRYPDSILTALIGRPLTDIIDDPRLEGLTVHKAKTDSKDRLNVTVAATKGVPLRSILERMEGGR